MLLLLMHVIWLNLKKLWRGVTERPSVSRAELRQGVQGSNPHPQLMDLSNLQVYIQNIFQRPQYTDMWWIFVFLVFCINFLKYIFTITYSFTIQFRYRDDELLLCQEVVVENIMDEWYKNCRYGIWLSMRQRPTK